MRRAVLALLDAIVIGLMGIALNVSVAAIIYHGPLSVFVGRGVALSLVGGMVMGIVGARLCSWRSTICAPQNPIAVVVALFAGSIAGATSGPAAEHSFATVSAFVAATTLATGATAWLLGHLRLGSLVRYLPFPVVSGFLATTGYLLVTGGLGTAAGQKVTAYTASLLLDPAVMLRWLPWAAAAVLIVVVMRRLRRPIVLPAGLMLACALFYAALYALGLGLDGARRNDLLIGPFGGSFLQAFSGWRPLEIDGAALVRGIPTLLTVVGLSIVGAVMSASSIEVAARTRVDVDRDLRAVGVANVVAALGGGPPGYHSLALTLLASELRIGGPTNGLIVAGAAALALVAGAPVIGAMPVGVFSTGIMVVGLNMMLGPLIDTRRGMPAADYAVVLIIPLVTAAVGLLWGVAVGLLAAALSFVVAFARVDVLRLATTGARLHSRVERPEAQQARLAALGRRVAVYGLEGYLFFGTAHRLAQRIETALDHPPAPEHVLLDFRRVRGLDTSAARALARLDEACRARGVALRFTGLAGTAERLLRQSAPQARFVTTLDEALEAVEAELLSADPATADGAPDLIEDLRRRHPSADLGAYARAVSVPSGTEVIVQGAASDDMLVLRSGALRIEVTVEGAPAVIVARCLPGAIVGEIGLYAGVPRTARVVAEEPSSFLRIDAAALERMGRDDPALLADFHRLIAATLARRLGRTTALLADAEILTR